MLYGMGVEGACKMDLQLDVVVPVADVGRAEAFYESLDFRVDADVPGDGFRVLQLTPRGSPASIIFGNGVTVSTPGLRRASIWWWTKSSRPSNTSRLAASTFRRCSTTRGRIRTRCDGTSAPWTGSEPDTLRVVCVLQRPR